MKYLGGLKVLVVDDEPMLRELYVEEFADCGAIVQEAADGMAGMSLLGSETFDIVFTDYMMPKLSGVEFAAAVRKKLGPRPIIVLCTGYGRNASEDEIKAAGITAVFEKPFKLDNIHEALASLVRNMKEIK